MAPENVDPVMPVRVATAADLDDLTALFTAAFENDPVWSWAFPDSRDLAQWWRFLVGSALRYPNVWVYGDCAAASVWIPPGGSELTEEEDQRVESLLTRLVGPRVAAVMELLERFEASHPQERPHYYLSLLGIRPDHRGQGLGMGLLADNLALIDVEQVPTFLESSNPRNNPRYERLGYGRVGEFTTPDGEHPLATMWREPGDPG